MIKTIRDYEKRILRFIREFGDRELLYRGQSNHKWTIKSSLERDLDKRGIEEIQCKEYYAIIDRYKPLMNPHIQNRYERKSTRAGYDFDFHEYYEGSWLLPDMEYMAYLRQHSFPTPSIDLSKSYFVALFFACEDFNQDSKVDGKVFIYARPQVWVDGNNIPSLRKIGRYVEAGKRHFAQQSQYLMPTIYDTEWKFIPFRKVIEVPNNNHEFREIIISKNFKAKLMKELNNMNINRYSMFLDEDALIKAFADDWALERA